MNKNQTAWLNVDKAIGFSKDVEEHGFSVVNMRDIKKHAGRELRLIMKQDKRTDVPASLGEGGSISISRNKVLFTRKSLHLPLNPNKIKNEKILKIGSKYNPLIDPKSITTEPEAISCAEYYGIFSDFLSDKNLHSIPTGKHGLFAPFEIDIGTNGDKKTITIENPQIECDCCLMSNKSLYTIEAKLDAKEMHSRQLLYPLKNYELKIKDLSLKMTVQAYVLNYRMPFFELYEYKLSEPRDIFSWSLGKTKRYILTREQTLDIEYIEKHELSPMEDTPFPQADSLNLIFKTVEILARGLDKQDWVTEVGYEPRQFDYYFNAGKYLRLISGRPAKPEVTAEGKKLIKLDAGKRFDYTRSILANSKLFRECAKLKIENMEIISDILKRFHPDLISEAVVRRRAQTVKSWLIALGMHK